MKTNPSSTRGFLTLLAYHERSRHNPVFQRSVPCLGAITGIAGASISRIEIAPALTPPTANLLTQPRRKVAA
jgi:hypothetical protein